jgi:NAD(P)-dependent dehydrogenase (short-subunit alcohol dehydrogenase family)
MKERVVLLTGSSGRLGKAFIEKYGKNYIIVGVNRGRKLTETLPDDSIVADVRKKVDKTIKYVLSNYGRIDLLINNAATYTIKPLVDFTRMEFMEQFNVNVISPLILSSSIVKQFWRDNIDDNRKYNRNIVNVSSISATEVFKGQGTYAPTKAALNMLTLHMAEEFTEYGIRVNAISPTSFPAIISAEKVADEIVKFDSSNYNGKVKEIRQ